MLVLIAISINLTVICGVKGFFESLNIIPHNFCCTASGAYAIGQWLIVLDDIN